MSNPDLLPHTAPLGQRPSGLFADHHAAVGSAHSRSEELLVGYNEAAHRLGVGRTTLKKLVACHCIDSVRIQGRVLFRVADLEAFAAALPVADLSGAPQGSGRAAG